MANLGKQISELSSTKKELLELLLRQQNIDIGESLLVARTRSNEGQPLSYAQRRLWLSHELEPTSPLFNLPAAIRLEGTLDVGALRRTLAEVVSRHEILRTVFTASDGEPEQVPRASVAVPLPVIDLSTLPSLTREAEVSRLLAVESRRPFDLAAGPLLRPTLLRVGRRDHVLLITMHHIVSDGWSVGVLIREVVSLYEAFTRGKASALPKLAIQYADYAIWQREWLKGPRLEKQLGYWRSRLAGSSARLDLPTDRPAPSHARPDGAACHFEISDALTKRLRELSRQSNATLFMTLLAAFQTLLHRYTGQTDFNIGSPIAGRQMTEVSPLIGFFVNFLVLRSDLAGTPTFRELLERVRGTTLEALEHQDLPFELLVEELKPRRTPGRLPFFRVIFDLNNNPSETLTLPDLAARVMHVGTASTHADWVVNMLDDGVRLTGKFVYSTDLFDSETIERTIARFLTLLERVVENPDERIARVPILPDEEREQILQWGRRVTTFPPGPGLHERFEAIADQFPDRVAIVLESEHISYDALDRRSNRLAHALRSLGVAPGQLVGVYMDRSVDLVVAVLGVLKAGAAYLPMDPAYPAERVAFMLKDAEAPVVLTQQKLLASVSTSQARVLCIDEDWSTVARHSAERPSFETDSDGLAYVIYTSGSTGTPKGCEVTHHNVMRLFESTDEWFGFDADDVWTLFHSVAFDFSVWEIWGALLYGGRLVVVPFLLSRSPDHFYELLEREQVTVLNQTPSAFKQLIRAEERGEPARIALRYIVFGGEALDLHALAPWFRSHGDRQPQLINMYGITETTVHVTYRPITVADLDTADTSRIGRPLLDLELLLLDPYGNPAPIGIPGEIHVGGGGVARGYHKRPALTASRFVPSPLADTRLYRSGDLARYLPDGDIEYLGRADDQVKIRGFRIETGEIEAALRASPAVRDTLVVATPDAAGETRLVAYVVPTAEHGLQAADLRSSLRATLPEYMVPSAFITIAEFPLTANGKVDRKALPPPDAADGAGTETSYVEPQTEIEKRLAAIWEQVLNRRRIGVNDNFFDLGGHSLLATRVVARAREAFGVELPLGVIFEGPTVANMATAVEAVLDTRDAPRIDRITRAAPRAHIPLSFSQQRLWFLEQLEPGNSAYVIPAAVRLTGSLRLDALDHAFNKIVRRHDTLRTAFRAVAGEPEQRIAAFRRLTPPLVDLTELEPAAREAYVGTLIGQESCRPFELDRPPLIRLIVVRLAADEHIVLLFMHHIISDAWSIGVFVEEFAALYASHLGDKAAGSLPSLPIQFSDFAVWQRQHMRDRVLRRHLNYWRGQLAGLPVLNLPTDRPRPPQQTFSGAWQSVELGADTSEAIRALARRENATTFMLLLAAFQILLARYCDQDDIAVGTDIAGRNRAQTEGLIGLFVNQLVLRTRLDGDPTFTEALSRVRLIVLAAFEHQDLPFEKLVEELQPKRDPSRNPLFQVMFILQNAHVPTLRLPGLTLTQVPIEQATSVFDMSLIITERENGQFQVLCRYNTDLFLASTIARMLRELDRLLGVVTTEPDIKLSSIALRTASDQQVDEAQIARRRSKQLSKLAGLKPKSMQVASAELVKKTLLDAGQPLPLVLEPASRDLDLRSWAEAHRERLERDLQQHGAVLFRGFDIPSLAYFESVTRAVSPSLMDYSERSSPRHQLSGRVYTSTDHPADQPIVLHNEQSYTLNWMMKLWFHCVRPPSSRGRTPIADSRRILNRLSPDTQQSFLTKGVMYLRNYGTGLGLSWREAFQTDDRAEVERHCTKNAIEWEWVDEERLRTRQTRPAIRRHPKTGEATWFNHAMFFHITSLEAETREAITAGLAADDLPFNTFYGDGTPFAPETLEEIRSAYAAETVAFDWMRNDILLIDNMLVAHGREPFEGPRQIAVAMAEPFSTMASKG